MPFRDLLETAQSLALADKLQPNEVAVWEYYCREFSTKFSTPLLEVRNLDPLFVIKEVSSLNLSELNVEEHLIEVQEMIASLLDPEYDVHKERAIREELRQVQEREEERLREGKAIHPSLEKDKRVITKEDTLPKNLPKSGSLNMNLINQLNNSNKEG